MTGFTPSFLIGAALPEGSKLTEGSAFGALTSLLTDFRNNTRSGYDIVIGQCTAHHQPIAALYERKESKPRCEAVLDHNGSAGSLYAERQYFARKELSMDSLATGLWRTFGHPLVSAEYSIRNNAYCAFDAEDHELIEAAQK